MRYEPAVGHRSLTLLNKVMEPDLRGGDFDDKLQMVTNSKLAGRTTRKALGDTILISLLLKTLTPSLRGQGNSISVRRPRLPVCRRVPFVSKDNGTPLDALFTHDDPWRSMPWTRAKGKGKSEGQGKDASGEKGTGRGKQPKARRLLVGTAVNLDTDKRIARLLKLRQRQQFVLQLLHHRLSQMHNRTCSTTVTAHNHVTDPKATPPTVGTLADAHSALFFRPTHVFRIVAPSLGRVCLLTVEQSPF